MALFGSYASTGGISCGAAPGLREAAFSSVKSTMVLLPKKWTPRQANLRVAAPNTNSILTGILFGEAVTRSVPLWLTGRGWGEGRGAGRGGMQEIIYHHVMMDTISSPAN